MRLPNYLNAKNKALKLKFVGNFHIVTKCFYIKKEMMIQMWIANIADKIIYISVAN